MTHDEKHAQLESNQPKQKTGVVRFILATEAWKNSFRNLGHRASFPLLRQMFRKQKHQAQSTTDLEMIDPSVLNRSKQAHLLALFLLTPGAVWAVLCTTKGVAALIKFGTLTSWLYMGGLVAVFAFCKMFVSYKSLGILNAEIDRRNSIGNIK